MSKIFSGYDPKSKAGKALNQIKVVLREGSPNPMTKTEIWGKMKNNVDFTRNTFYNVIRQENNLQEDGVFTIKWRCWWN